MILRWDTRTQAVLHRLSTDRFHERMTIRGATGINAAQRAALVVGVVEQSICASGWARVWR